MIVVCALFLLGINLAAIGALASDKQRARRGEWRIAESTLLGLALSGGSPGAFWARRRFRHKTRKQPFSNVLQAIAALQVAVVTGLVVGLAPAIA